MQFKLIDKCILREIVNDWLASFLHQYAAFPHGKFLDADEWYGKLDEDWLHLKLEKQGC